MADEREKVVFTSLDPSDAVRGGLISDVDVRVKDIVWTLECPEGYSSREPTFFIKGYLELIAETNVFEEVWWSCGTRKNHTPCDEEGNPTDEGYRLTGGPLMQGSNAIELLDSLKKCGFPVAKLKACNLKEVVDLEMHVIRKVIEREGLQRAPREDGRTPAGVVICQKIIRVPGEKRAAKPKPAAAAAATSAARPAARTAAAAKPAAAAPPAAATTDTESLAGIVLADLMNAKPEGLLVSDAKIQANRALFSAHKLSLVDRTKVIELMLDPIWLESQGVLLEGETLVLMA